MIFYSADIMNAISLEGPVEKYKGQLALRIPLDAGGYELAPFAVGIGAIDGGFLAIIIQSWLAEQLNVGEGSLVFVDNRNGKLNITRSPANDT